MLFYGMMVWILFVIAVWGVGVVRILFFEEDRKHRTFKKTLLKISKWTLKLFGVFLAVAVIGSMAFSYKYQKECGPDSADVKVMKPMAKAISDYIVKHGIPKSLSEIPNLPYRLEGCEREEYYSGAYGKKVPKREAFGYDIDIQCKTERDITVTVGSFIDFEDNTTYMGVNFESPNRTVYGISMQKKANETTYEIEEDKPVRFKSDGICNPLKQ